MRETREPAVWNRVAPPTVPGRVVPAKVYLDEVRSCLDELSEHDLRRIAEVLYKAYVRGQLVFVIGNGGSSATASHFALHLRSGLGLNGDRGMRALCLTDNAPLVTALANDVSYSSVFALQLAPLVEEGDVLIAISGSGNSANVLEAVRLAKERGATIIGLCGFGGGALARLADCAVVLSCDNYGPVEDAHLTLAHLLPQMLRERIVNGKQGSIPRP
jgi:D-sedoheptulose 7-phosphate isomerase